MRYRTDRDSALAVAICASVAAVGSIGGAAAAFASLGSSQMLTLCASAAIAIGGALLLHGTGAAVRAKRKFRRLGDRLEVVGLVGGVGAELVGGAAAATLGITALGDVLPFILLPCAAVAAGGAALLVAPAHHRLSQLARVPRTRQHRIVHETVGVTAWLLALAGMTAIMLGTLALLEVGPELVLCAWALGAVGIASAAASVSLAVRYAVQLSEYDDAADDDYASTLIELLQARLTASHAGVALYVAAVERLDGFLDKTIVDRLDRFADLELENRDFLEYQIEGLGGDPGALTELGEIESEAISGAEHLLLQTDLADPLYVLQVLHTADAADAMGWKLLAQVAEEIGHEELKHEIKVKYGDKLEQMRFVSRVIEELAAARFVGEPLFTPMIA